MKTFTGSGHLYETKYIYPPPLLVTLTIPLARHRLPKSQAHQVKVENIGVGQCQTTSESIEWRELLTIDMDTTFDTL